MAVFGMVTMAAGTLSTPRQTKESDLTHIDFYRIPM